MDTEHFNLRARRLITAGTAESRVLQRLLAKTTPGPDGCIIWTARVDRGGYGKLRVAETNSPAHRVSYGLLVAPVADGLQLDHLCHTRDRECPGGKCLHRRCINPNHLEPVSHTENQLRSPYTFGSVHAAATHCPQGHPYDAVNTYPRPGGGRECKECRREAVRKYRASRRAAPPNQADEALRRVREGRRPAVAA